MSAALQDGLRDHNFDRQIALVGEHWRAVRRLWLDGIGITRIKFDLPEDFLLGIGMPGLATIKPIKGGLFEFTENGLAAVVVPAYDGLPGLLDANPERHVEHLVDLVAVDLDRPERFWRRHGKAVLLGNAFLEIAGETCEPVPVFKTPLSWLKAGGAGICILDWDHAKDLLLGRELLAEDLGLGDRLEDALKPDIWIMEAAA